MQILLQILGGLFLLLILVIVVAFFILRAKLRQFMGGLKEMGEQMEYSVTPPRLHLVRQDLLDWSDAEKATTLGTLLKGAGFTDAGYFVPDEMSFLKIQALVHEAESAAAVIYEHPKAGIWLDLYTRYLDGSAVTYSTAPQGGELDAPPNRTRVYEANVDPGEFIRRFLSSRPRDGREPMTAAGFAARFEKAYADEMDWRNSRGGATEDEIRRSLQVSGESFTEENVREIREIKVAQAMEDLDVGLRERFEQETSWTVPEWEEKRDRLLFIHDQLPAETLWQRFRSAVPVDAPAEDESEDEDGEDGPEEVPAHVRSLPPRQAFSLLNAEADAHRRCEKAGELSHPLPTDVYVAPRATEWNEG